MGRSKKGKKRDSNTSDVTVTADGAPEASIAKDITPTKTLETWLGQRTVTARLDSVQDLSGSWGDCRLLLPPLSIYDAKLATSQHVLVGMLRHPGAAPAEASGLTSAATGGSAGACAYVWHALARQHGLHVHPLPEQQHAGSFVVPATVYPSPRLTAGSAAASSSLAASLGRPSIGTDLGVYPWPAAAAQPSRDKDMRADGNSSLAQPAVKVAKAVYVRQLVDMATELPASFGGAAAGATPPSMLSKPTPHLRKARDQHRAMLQGMAAAKLQGRVLLPGNAVTLTHIGQELLLAVEGADVSADLEQGFLVGKDTAVHVLLSSERMPQPASLKPPEADPAQAAADAADEAVGGGPEGPAAAAARRAAASGLAAPRQGFAGVGGASAHMASLRELVTLPLQAPVLFESMGLRPPRGVLLHGPPGTGKTMLACAAAADARARLFVLNGPDIISEFVGESEAGLQGVFAAARAAAPAVVFIDEIDALAPARGGPSADSSAGEMTGRLVSTLLLAMEEGTSGVVVIAATNRIAALDSALRRPGRFDRELEVAVPSPAERLDILRLKLQTLNHSMEEGDVEAIAAASHGYVGADVSALCQEAAMHALGRHVAARESARRSQAGQLQGSSGAVPDSRSEHLAGIEGFRSGSTGAAEPALQVALEDFRAAQTRVRPSAMREVALELPRMAWGDVGGLDAIKQRLKEAVEWPQKHPELLRRLGAKAPRGVLLFGPPGCSKTMLARAVASESGLNFLAVKGAELFSKYVGESEKAIASLFARARAAAPAVIFFDELDGLAASRSEGGARQHGGTGVGERVLSQLLVEMDGLQARGTIVVLGATNRPDLVDAALLRPGRFDIRLFVPPPETAEARAAILRVLTQKTPLAADVDLAEIAQLTTRFTGADISALVREAAFKALEADTDAACVSQPNLLEALQHVKPSAPVTPAQARMYAAFKQGSH